MAQGTTKPGKWDDSLKYTPIDYSFPVPKPGQQIDIHAVLTNVSLSVKVTQTLQKGSNQA